MGRCPSRLECCCENGQNAERWGYLALDAGADLAVSHEDSGRAWVAGWTWKEACQVSEEPEGRVLITTGLRDPRETGLRRTKSSNIQ